MPRSESVPVSSLYQAYSRLLAFEGVLQHQARFQHLPARPPIDNSGSIASQYIVDRLHVVYLRNPQTKTLTISPATGPEDAAAVYRSGEGEIDALGDLRFGVVMSLLHPRWLLTSWDLSEGKSSEWIPSTGNPRSTLRIIGR